MIELADYQLRIANESFGVSSPVHLADASRSTVLVGCSRSDAEHLQSTSGEPALLVHVRGGAHEQRVFVESVDAVENTIRLRVEVGGLSATRTATGAAPPTPASSASAP